MYFSLHMSSNLFKTEDFVYNYLNISLMIVVFLISLK